MHKHWFNLALASGALAIVWVGFGFWVSNPLALAVTLLIGAVYALGTQELRQYRLATGQLSNALKTVTAPVAQLEDWLQGVPASLQTACACAWKANGWACLARPSRLTWSACW